MAGSLSTWKAQVRLKGIDGFLAVVACSLNKALLTSTGMAGFGFRHGVFAIV